MVVSSFGGTCVSKQPPFPDLVAVRHRRGDWEQLRGHSWHLVDIEQARERFNGGRRSRLENSARCWSCHCDGIRGGRFGGQPFPPGKTFLHRPEAFSPRRLH